MYKIYKITCLITNKVYIGKTTKNNVKERWYEHVTNALTKNLQTHLCNAIRLYGDNQFLIEAIDYADNEEELNKKEKYWIKYYNSVLEGYNETEGGEGGNTYQYKTEEEMKVIKDKIRQSKLKGLNPHARKVKCKNVNTNEEYHFNSVAEMKEFFNHENHSFIIKRCTNETKCLWQNEWAIAYEENDYNTSSTNYKNNARSKRI